MSEQLWLPGLAPCDNCGSLKHEHEDIGSAGLLCPLNPHGVMYHFWADPNSDE